MWPVGDKNMWQSSSARFHFGGQCHKVGPLKGGHNGNRIHPLISLQNQQIQSSKPCNRIKEVFSADACPAPTLLLRRHPAVGLLCSNGNSTAGQCTKVSIVKITLFCVVLKLLIYFFSSDCCECLRCGVTYSDNCLQQC